MPAPQPQREGHATGEVHSTAGDATWVWECGADLRVTWLSSEFPSSSGLPARSVLGQNLSTVAPLDADASAQRAALSHRKAFQGLIFPIKHQDGDVWLDLAGFPVTDSEGRFGGYRGTGRTVTMEIEAACASGKSGHPTAAETGSERALRESEQRLRQVLEAAADYSWEQDAQYRLSYLSPSFETLTGIPVSAALGRRLNESTGVSIDPEMGRMVLRAYATKQAFRDLVYSRKMPDGSTRWFKVSGAPTFDASGAFIGYRGLGADITENVAAEAAMQLAHQRLHETVAYVTQPIVVYDADDQVAAFNQAFANLHKMQNVVTPVYQRFTFRTATEWQLHFGFFAHGPSDPVVDLETLLARYRTETEHTYRLHDGRWMMVVYRALPGGARVGLWTDITAIKHAEMEHRLLEAQLHHSQRLEALGTLAGGVAHEINNALVPVIALGKMMASKVPAESRERRNLDAIVTGAERSRDLVKQIVAFSRKEDEERRRERLDLSTVLRDALRLMRATIQTSIRIVPEIVPTPAITGDPGQLQQVIVNIMTNAAQAIGEAAGTIRVTLRPEADGAHLCLSIGDSGCGMDQATVARVFEPFFTTKPVGEGTGLGLSVAHGIVKAHGGRIEVASAPGQGTRFDIFLPVTPIAAGEAA